MKLPEDLYVYQKEDVDKILNNDDSFLILSEMGTGKTPVALAVSQMGQYNGKTLIVCPKTLQLEWARQIKEWCGLEASVAKKSSYRKLQTLFEEFYTGEDSPFFIINYESFRVDRHRQILNGYPFGLIILDEVHQMRNIKSKQTKGLLEFFSTQEGTKTLALTGSPIVNNPADLHTLLCIVRPEEFSSRNRQGFIDRYCYYSTKRGKMRIYAVRDVAGLKMRTDPYTVRRTKQEVLPFLPEKYVRKVLLDMDEDQRRAYDSMAQDLFVMLDDGTPIWAPHVLSELTRLRQLNLDPKILGVSTPSSKTDFLMDLIDELQPSDPEEGPGNNENDKLVVFSCFETYVSRVSKLLAERGLQHVSITGKVGVEDRAKAIDRFQTDPEVKIALGTVQSMGVGLTLTASSNCVFMDRWWNPAVNDQAVDRLHRIGQKNAVQIILPINDKSIDSSLDRILENKKKLSKEYLGDNSVIQEVVEDMRRESRLEASEEKQDMLALVQSLANKGKE